MPPHTRRPDAADRETGERLDDVLMFRVADLAEKELLLADVGVLLGTGVHANSLEWTAADAPRPEGGDEPRGERPDDGDRARG